MVYVLKFTDDALADVKRMPANERNALKKELLDKLAKDPGGCSEALVAPPLDSFGSFHWRDYRIIFKVYEDLMAIGIAGIGKHDPQPEVDIYRKLEALAHSGKLVDKMLIAFRDFT